MRYLTGAEEWAVTNQCAERTAVLGTEAETGGLGCSQGTSNGALRKHRFWTFVFSARFPHEAETVLVQWALLPLSKLQGSKVAVASRGEGSTRRGEQRNRDPHSPYPPASQPKVDLNWGLRQVFHDLKFGVFLFHWNIYII